MIKKTQYVLKKKMIRSENSAFVFSWKHVVKADDWFQFHAQLEHHLVDLFYDGFLWFRDTKAATIWWMILWFVFYGGLAESTTFLVFR